MAWFFLVVAGLFETFAVAMLSQYTITGRKKYIFLMVIGFVAGLGLLSYSLQSIDMGTAYAIWTGISVVASSLIGILYFRESADLRRILCIVVILSSVVGLKLMG